MVMGYALKKSLAYYFIFIVLFLLYSIISYYVFIFLQRKINVKLLSEHLITSPTLTYISDGDDNVLCRDVGVGREVEEPDRVQRSS